MSDESPWLTKAQMMARLKRSERTLQVMVRDGRIERRIGEDKRSYYRVAQQVAAPQRDAAEAPPWAVELLEEIRALRAENAAYRAAQGQIGYDAGNASPGMGERQSRAVSDDHETPGSTPGAGSGSTPPRSDSQPRSDPQREGWWARLWERLS